MSLGRILPARESRAAADAPCANCGAAQPRREFVRESARALAGVAAALGLTAERATALTLRVTSALRAHGSEVTYPLPAEDGATIDKEHEAILVRDQNAVYAFALSCPHQRTPLRWLDDQRRFQCPKHKSAYQPDGAFISGRATRGMDRYAIRRDAGTVLVDLARVFRQDQDPAGWDAAIVRL